MIIKIVALVVVDVACIKHQNAEKSVLPVAWTQTEKRFFSSLLSLLSSSCCCSSFSNCSFCTLLKFGFLSHMFFFYNFIVIVKLGVYFIAAHLHLVPPHLPQRTLPDIQLDVAAADAWASAASWFASIYGSGVSFWPFWSVKANGALK